MDKLPPFIQDYSYVLSQYSNQKMYVDPQLNNKLHIADVSDKLIVHLSPAGDYELTVRSEDGFDQTTKELQTANIPYPYMQEFKTRTFFPDGSCPGCECSTPYGPPDFVFLRLERKYLNNARTVPFDPVIKTLKMDIRFQDVKTVSDLDANQLYQLTRRNSNFRADAALNYQKYGAVLFRKQDLGNWSRWDGDTNDVFSVTFTANSFDTYSAAQVANYPAAVTADIDYTPIRLVVVFIYKDYSFSGKYNECKFDFTKK
jgi:hypothetical protein